MEEVWEYPGEKKRLLLMHWITHYNVIKNFRTQFSLVPVLGRILLSSTISEGSHILLKEQLIPFAINMPMLHGMSHIGGLNKMLQNNGSWWGAKEEKRAIH